MQDKKFSIGQKVTFKPRSLCKNRSGEKLYMYGGVDQGGVVGTVSEYGSYQSIHECWDVYVTFRGNTYVMIESEFYEYDSIKPEFSVGDEVVLAIIPEGAYFWNSMSHKYGGEKGRITSIDTNDNTCEVFTACGHQWFKFSELELVKKLEFSGEVILVNPHHGSSFYHGPELELVKDIPAPKQPEQVIPAPTKIKAKSIFNY
jgi:hypothetical protein